MDSVPVGFDTVGAVENVSKALEEEGKGDEKQQRRGRRGDDDDVTDKLDTVYGKFRECVCCGM